MIHNYNDTTNEVSKETRTKQKRGNNGQLQSRKLVKTDFEGECCIARKSDEINVIVYYPKTEKGKRELARRVAGVHADMVQQYIKKLDCPLEQKTQLVDAVIQTAFRPRTQRQATQERNSR